jgi:Zn-dependent protease
LASADARSTVDRTGGSVVSSGPNYRYTYSYTPNAPSSTRAQTNTGAITTSPTELRHLSLAFVVLTLDFTFVILGGAAGVVVVSSAYLIQVVLTAAAAGLTAFVAHEMAHKVSAQRRGYWAEFRMSSMWLLFSLFVSAAAGFLFAAPGATVIGGMERREDWGRTSLAGPLTNIGFAAAFYAAAIVLIFLGSYLAFWLMFLAFINGWLATFNLLPVGPLDGHKVLSWNAGVWVGAIAVGVVMAVLPGLALYFGFIPFAG